MTIFLLSVICLLAVICFWSIRKNLQYSEKLQEVGDQVEESLDVLDACYQRAAERAKLEVFTDEPVVKELLEDIRTTRDAILLVANLIVEPLKETSEE